MTQSVLIVESQAFLRQVLRTWLTKTLPGSKIHEASCETEAFTHTETSSPSMIILHMGPVHAYNLAAASRLKATAPHAKIVVLTTYENDVFDTKATDAGVNMVVPMSELAPGLAQVIAQ